MCNVVPAICRLIIGRTLGFGKGRAGSLSQYNYDILTFFKTGTWDGWEIEKESFEEWFYKTQEFSDE